MSEENTHEVDFKKYCNECKYKELKSDEDPCHDCLNHPYNFDSRKPWEFKEK